MDYRAKRFESLGGPEALRQLVKSNCAAEERHHLAYGSELHVKSLEMWEKITKSDIQGARTQLGLKRAEMLRRHAEELSDLDAQLQDIERFDRIVAAFF